MSLATIHACILASRYIDQGKENKRNVCYNICNFNGLIEHRPNVGLITSASNLKLLLLSFAKTICFGCPTFLTILRG